MNKRNNELVKEFRSHLADEVEGETSKSKEETLREIAESFSEDYDPYSEAEKYLNTLSEDEFFYVYTAWSIGQEIMTTPEGFWEFFDIAGSKEKLFEAYLKDAKTGFSSRHVATDQLMSKKEPFIKECLDYYLDFSL